MKKEIIKVANQIARKNGYNKATEVIIINDNTPKILKSVAFGYRKFTTGKYVPNAYRANFGWKNTYYQNVICVVGVPRQMIKNYL